jgi:hypothetical protein
MNIDTSAVVTRQQLLEVISALESVVAKRSDLVELASITEKVLPGLIAKAGPIGISEKPQIRWIVEIERDPDTKLASGFVMTPEISNE